MQVFTTRPVRPAMSDEHNNYRPRSPELPAYRPQPPRLASYDSSSQSGFPAGYNLTHRASFDASPYFSPQTPQASHSCFPQQPQAAYNPFGFAPNLQSPSYTKQSTVQPLPLSRVTTKSLSHPPLGSCAPTGDMPRKRTSDDEHDEIYTPQGSAMAGGRASKKRRPDNATQTGAGRSGPSPSLGIEVKTKFPVARIKRIMQADEDVGKVAQATPTAVSKALELFMITLVTKAATEASHRQSKRVTAAHLKQAVLADENLDFLQDIVSKVPDPTEKKTRAKSEDSAEPEDAGRRKRAGARRKKVEADDD